MNLREDIAKGGSFLNEFHDGELTASLVLLIYPTLISPEQTRRQRGEPDPSEKFPTRRFFAVEAVGRSLA